MVKKLDPPGVYTEQTDPETGEKTLIPDPSASAFSFDSNEVETWAKNGELPAELAEHHLEKIREHTELMEELQKRFGPNPTPEQRLLVLQERYANKPKGWLDKEVKNVVNFQKFLEKNWERLAGIIPAAQRIRHSRDLVDNKFPSELDILKSSGDRAETSIEPLQLTEAQDRLVFTLCQLLSKKSERWRQDSPDYYMGNHEAGLVELAGQQIPTARLLVTPYELAKEYYGRTNFNSDHMSHLLAAVNELADRSFTLVFTQQKKKDGATRYNRIRMPMPLFLLALVDEDLTEHECKTITGNIIHESKTKLLFRLSPIFTKDIAQRYIEFPEDLHIRMTKTKAAGTRGRIGQHAHLFRDYLLRELSAGNRGKRQKDKNGDIVFERDEEKLVAILGLLKEWEAGRKSRVRGYFQKTFNIFLELGLLKSVEKLDGVKRQLKYKFTINGDFK